MKEAVKLLPMHILVTLFVAPLSVVLFTNIFTGFSEEMSESHDNGIKLDYLVETVSEVKHSIDTNLPKLTKLDKRLSVMEVEVKHLTDTH